MVASNRVRGGERLTVVESISPVVSEKAKVDFRKVASRGAPCTKLMMRILKLGIYLFMEENIRF